MKPLVVALGALMLAMSLACLAEAPASAHPRSPPHRLHCKPPFRLRWISLPTGQRGWKCVAAIKPLP